MSDPVLDRSRRPGGNKKDDVYEHLVGRLLRGDFAFGERLLVKELAADIGVSRQPIMAALNRLAAEGFVRIIPQVGCQLIDPGIDEIADFFTMFQRLEGLLAELAARRRSDGELHELRRIQAQIAALDGAGDHAQATYVQLNRAFHALIHQMARSPLLDERQRANFNMVDFFITHTAGFAPLMQGVDPEHDAIISAIERHNSERARALTEVHIGTVADTVLAALERHKNAA